jgi:serine/threonine protein phosphatase PrpC
MCSAEIGLGRLFIVADGMGGHKGGALAAQLTIDGLRRVLEATPSAASIAVLLRQAFDETNQAVYRMAHADNPETRGMGSTAVLLLIRGRTAHIAHVGDSRAYLVRKGRLRRLTTDHTRAQRMVDAAILTPEQALNHPSASVLERAVGIKPAVEFDLTEVRPIATGDAFLLCSDGLSGCVGDSEIEEVLKGNLPIAEIPKHLIDLALQKGSKDNITVQYLQYRQVNEGGSGRIVAWTAVIAAALVLLMALVYWFSSSIEFDGAKPKEATKEAPKTTK